MKRILIFVLVLLPILAFSQMQHIISQGNTATTQRITSYQNTIDSNLIRLRSIDENNLVTNLYGIYKNQMLCYRCVLIAGRVVFEENFKKSLTNGTHFVIIR